jgi:hypothetical protein
MPRGRKAPAPAQPTQAAAPTAPIVLDIQINLDGLTIGDLRLFAALKNGTADEMALVDLFNRCVVGGVDHLPMRALSQVALALADAMRVAQSPNS